MSPRFDGTGPFGQGPFSGKGLGYCVEPLPRRRRPIRQPMPFTPFPCRRGRGLQPCGPYGRGLGRGRFSRFLY